MKNVAVISTHSVRRAALALVAALLPVASGCSGAVAPSGPVELSPSVAKAGDTIYFGKVFPLEGGQSDPTFVYERRVAREGDHWLSTHITREPDGDVVFAETAVHDAHYALRGYTLYGNQRGQRGSVEVKGHEVTMRLRGGGEETVTVEEQADDVVVGPTLVGYIIEHVQALRRGEVLPVRLALVERQETLGFALAIEDAAEGQTRVRMTPTSFFVGLVVDPIHYTFDSRSMKLLELEGRVPPKRRDGDRLRDFDARVEYTFVAEAYR